MSLVVLIALAGSVPAAQAQSRGNLFPRTTDNVHLEMVFNYNVTDPGTEKGVVDMVWGSNYPTRPPSVYNSVYIPYSVDNFTYNLHWYYTNHPDWLEYLCDRTTLAFEFGTTTLAPLDFTNPAVQAFQWSNWVDAPLGQGFKGIAVDTMSLTNNWQRCGHYDGSGNWVQQYSGKFEDPVFRKDVLAWESATYQHVHSFSPTATMQVNVSYQFNETRADNLQLMTTTDLLFDERGFTNYGVPPNVPPPGQWQGIVSAIQYVQSKGLCYMTNGEESGLTMDIPQSARLWAISNYLLIKNDCTYMYMTGYTSDGGQDYGSLITFPEYSIQIGHPTGAMKKTHGIWTRQYSGGLTLVNPYNQTATVTLPPGSYVDVNGNPVGPTVTLGQQTGQVLLLVQ